MRSFDHGQRRESIISTVASHSLLVSRLTLSAYKRMMHSIQIAILVCVLAVCITADINGPSVVEDDEKVC